MTALTPEEQARVAAYRDQPEHPLLIIIRRLDGVLAAWQEAQKRASANDQPKEGSPDYDIHECQGCECQDCAP